MSLNFKGFSPSLASSKTGSQWQVGITEAVHFKIARSRETGRELATKTEKKTETEVEVEEEKNGLSTGNTSGSVLPVQ